MTGQKKKAIVSDDDRVLHFLLFVCVVVYRCNMMGTQRLLHFPLHDCAYFSSAYKSKALVPLLSPFFVPDQTHHSLSTFLSVPFPVTHKTHYRKLPNIHSFSFLPRSYPSSIMPSPFSPSSCWIFSSSAFASKPKSANTSL